MMIFIIAIVSVYTVLQAILLGVTDNDLSSKWYVKIKMLSSTAFLIFAIIIYLLCANRGLDLGDYVMFLGLIACWVGDLFLGKYNQDGRKPDMFKGIISFALAHVGFLFSMFLIHPQLNAFVVLCPVIMLILLALITGAFHLKMGSLKPACFTYSIFVSTMFAKAVYDIYAIGTVAAILLGVGGILFFISDISITFLYFYHFPKRWMRKLTHYFNLVTYFYGILFFIVSLLFR